jgi:hypothetical protein
MRKHKSATRATITAVISAVALAVPATALATISGSSAVPAFCTSAGPISATALASPVNLGTCPIQGRLVISVRGVTHLGLHVPPPGHAYATDALTTTGDRYLVVTNMRGRITASTAPTAFTPPRERSAHHVSPATDPACSELGVQYLGFLWVTPLNWYYNESTASRAGLDGPTTLTNIRQANSNMTLGMNNCGWSQTGFGAYGSYQGTTSKYANINSAGQCTSNFPDGQNTVSWGPFDSSAPTTLAQTCYDYDPSTKYANEADTYIGSNRAIVNTLPADCLDQYDLQTIMTHEWGHAYGLDHETTGPDEVMFITAYDCSLRRHLGEGDYNGMATLYGFR